MTFSFSSQPDSLFFIPIGGSNEIGMNLNLYHLDGKWLMVDMGIGFVDDHYPGVEIMVPDTEFLISIKEDILGLVVTHAHEDHLGAVPYIWDEIGCPIYATRFTASVLRHKLQGNSMFNQHIPVNEVEIGSEFSLGAFTLDLIPLTHSIPEMQAIAIKTRHGTIMHTGDWKLDADPLVGQVSDEETLKRYGDEGVLAMVCDSTNAFVEGESGSESDVRKALTEQIAKQQNRVFVASFASNIARVESILYAAKDAGRSVVLAGRSLWRTVSAAQESGYLQDIPELISEKEASNLPKNQQLVLCTGCQGEPRAALSKIVSHTHPSINISSEDTVIFSSRVIPGNETRLNWMTNQLVKQHVNIITDKDAFIHVSGHPARDELRRMYELVRPQISVPVHGEAAHIREHAIFAESLGVPQSIQPYNGAVVKLSKDDSAIVDDVPTNYLGLDGTTLIPLTSPIIKMRRRLRDNGVLVASVIVGRDGDLASKPYISAPGCMDIREDEDLRKSLEQDIIEMYEQSSRGGKSKGAKDKIRNMLRKAIQREIGKKPVIEVHIHQI